MQWIGSIKKKKLDSVVANKVWDVLMELCGATEKEREEFVSSQRNNNDEYRFNGNLGFGGKFYNSPTEWRVGCSKRDDTPERLTAIAEANVRLLALKTEYENPISE